MISSYLIYVSHHQSIYINLYLPTLISEFKKTIVYNDIIYLFISVSVHFITFFLTLFCYLPQWMLLFLCSSLSFSLPLLLFSEWLLFHVGCPCWKNKSNVVFTLKSHCFHDYKKNPSISHLCVIYCHFFFLQEKRVGSCTLVQWFTLSTHLTPPCHKKVAGLIPIWGLWMFPPRGLVFSHSPVMYSPCWLRTRKFPIGVNDCK